MKINQTTKQMAISIAFLLLVISLGYFFITKPTTQTENTVVRSLPSTVADTLYHSDGYGFEITGPAGWTEQEQTLRAENTTAVFFTNPIEDLENSTSFQANVIALVRPLSLVGVTTLEEYAALDKEMVNKYIKNAKILPDKEFMLSNGMWGIISGYTAESSNGLTIRDKHLIVIYDENAYVISGTALNSAWEKYERIFDSSINSFTFVN